MSMAKTVVGLMSSNAEAETVVRELTSTCQCDRADIGMMAKGPEETARTGDGGATSETHRGGDMSAGALRGAGTGAAIGGVVGLVAGATALTIPGLGPFIAAGPIASALAGAGIGAAAGGIIGALVNMGVPEEDAHYYAEGVRRGGTLITVHARTDEVADCAAEVMREHGAVDIEERAAQWKRHGWQGRFGDGQALQVAQEELAVGKRQVERGKVRLYSHVVEKPVEQTVRLKEEHAGIERHAVDRPAGDDAFKEKSIEVSETAEEPVVSKRSRVTEEVSVGKHATEREQKVHDTVRRTEVDVQKGGRYQGPERRTRTTGYRGPERRVA
jgi:uncharacterized protein (TIGR02271 family)